MAERRELRCLGEAGSRDRRRNGLPAELPAASCSALRCPRSRCAYLRRRDRGSGRRRQHSTAGAARNLRALLLASFVGTALSADCLYFHQFNSQREGNANLEEEYRITSNPAACSAQCAVTEGCVCFSYNQDNNRCFLMSSCKTPTHRHNFVAGEAGCVMPQPSPALCKVTVQTATPGAPVLRRDRKGLGRILQRVTDCAGGGGLFKVEWKAGVRNDYHIGCKHRLRIDLFHATCATEELLAMWANQITENEEQTLIVFLPEVPDLTGHYHPDGTFHQHQLWRSEDCNNGGLGCVLFSSGGGFWMISNQPDGHTRNVGAAKSEEMHEGNSPLLQKWQVLNGKDWQLSIGAVDTEEGMRTRGLDRTPQDGRVQVYLPELPSLIGTYRSGSKFHGQPLYRSGDCATGACVLFVSAGGYWMVSGRDNGHQLNRGLAKTSQAASGAGPEDPALTWEWHDRQGWRPTSGIVGTPNALAERGVSLQDSGVVVDIHDAPEVSGTYHAEGLHRGLPKFVSDDCPSGKCILHVDAGGHWMIADSPEAVEGDQGRTRSKQRLPHGRLAEVTGPDGRPTAVWSLQTDWEGQPELEPIAFQAWEYQMNSGAWRATTQAFVYLKHSRRPSGY
eukprot:TRINITY_DN3017_c0_g1_i7.p1 TRINITY_DN3017_c0_g1~~TRINITY_DN3017_c0_g1_i7.p1  ORF type:complete len:641 (+),score=90.07 TRINITY_DN3017_c0_g1_i7:67-1923(+)